MNTPARAPVPEGIEVTGVTAWFAEHAPDAKAPFTFHLIAGGHSNLTYRVADAGGQLFVLRRPPLGELLPSAHDMSREYRVMAALGPTPVPVPEMVGLCQDETVTGRPFYVMRYVDGLVLRDPAAVAQVSDATRWAAAESLIDGLVALHAVDPDSCGLGDLGRKEGYVERLLRRWRRQWDTAKQRDLPLIEEVGDRLARRIPEAGPARVVHGDYRLDNVIIDPATGAVRAVLDWELCTLGDPMADLGMLVVYWTEAGDSFSPLLNAPTTEGGFPGRKEIVDWYAAKSGQDVSELDFYVALGTWKLAMVLEGVYNRYNSGAYGETDGAWRRFDQVIPALAQAAHEAALRAGR
jgi:aminoglycoside phosphotransferase (APT) family kinase protein